MPTIINPAKQRLQQGQLALGMGVRGMRGVEVARVMKTAGYDFLFIDLEHGDQPIGADDQQGDGQHRAAVSRELQPQHAD